MPPSQKYDRLLWVDAFRGLAILLMIPANLAPYLAEPHPMWFRILGSYAAPMFISISAGMVMLRGESHPPWYYIKRGLLVLLIGAGLDAALWDIMPGTSWDVLYIIGPGMAVAYLSRKAGTGGLFAATAAIFTAAFVLRMAFGYGAEPLQVYWEEFAWPAAGPLFRSWFIDGWFPIFPWIGFTVFGVGFFGMMFKAKRDAPPRGAVAAAAASTIIGFALLFLPINGIENIAGGSIIETREGYSEIFYPPTLAYLLSAVGVVMLAGLLFRGIKPGVVWTALAFFGKYSMLVYILHQVIGDEVLLPLLESRGLEQMESGFLFTLVNLAVIGAIAIFGLLVSLYKRRFPPRLLLLRILIGR